MIPHREGWSRINVEARGTFLGLGEVPNSLWGGEGIRICPRSSAANSIF